MVDAGSLDPNRGFDEYGLDSIDAVIATDKLGERLGFDLAPELLLQHRTPNELFEALASEHGSANALPAIDTPIFLFPGGAGRDRSLARLKARCPPDITFHFASIDRWQEWTEKNFSFEDLVARVGDQVEERLPQGPVRLVGYSQGGQLAFAVALRLSARGREISTVSLFDSDGCTARTARLGITKNLTWLVKSTIKITQALLRRTFHRLGGLPLDANGYKRGDTRIRVLVEWCELRRRPDRARKALAGLARIAPVLFAGRAGGRLDNALQMQVFSDMWCAWGRENGREVKLPGSAILFRSEDPGLEDRGWASRCRDLKIIPLAGDHHSMFDQVHLDATAKRFLEVINSYG
jgi:thioesterase domain-containing protein/acyl carrier protein